MNKFIKRLIAVIAVIAAVLSIFRISLSDIIHGVIPDFSSKPASTSSSVDVTDYSNTAVTFNLTLTDGSTEQISIPQYDGTNDMYTVNNNQPYFIDSDLISTDPYLHLQPLDNYGRAQQANAIVNRSTLRQGERADISSIHPSGWYEAKASTVEVNRSHEIGSEIADGLAESIYGSNDVQKDYDSNTIPENTNQPENMLTLSRQANAGSTKVPGSMLDCEKRIINAQEDRHTIRYRVTPVFENVDVTAHGVLMEAESIDDGGQALTICTYVYNIQPGYTCNYTTGDWEEIPG